MIAAVDERFHPSEHGYILLDARLPGRAPLGVGDPVEDRVPVRAGQNLEHCLAVRSAASAVAKSEGRSIVA
jgi:hypothetical protein